MEIVSVCDRSRYIGIVLSVTYQDIWECFVFDRSR